MTNKQKAQEIADDFYNCYVVEGKESSCDKPYEDYEKSAMAMAEWKDKEFEYILTIAFETIGEQNGHCSKDLFEYLDVVRKLLKNSSNQ